MKFEEEIKQGKILDEWQKALLNIQYTGNWLVDEFLTVAKPYGINDQHYNILRILRGKHPGCACPGEIKEVLLNKRGDLTRLIDKLVKMELVERSTNKENRRMIDVEITFKGLELLQEMDEKIHSIEDLKKAINQEEAESLNQILDKIRNNQSK